MKKLISVLLVSVLLSGFCFAEGDVYTGWAIGGDIPIEAEVIDSYADNISYVEVLSYDDGCVTITAGAMPTLSLLNAYLEETFPQNDDVEYIEDDVKIADMETYHTRFTTGANEDTRVVDQYCAVSDDGCFMFVVSTDADNYEKYAGTIVEWVKSMELIPPAA